MACCVPQFVSVEDGTTAISRNMSKIGRHRYIRRTTCGSSDGERAEEGKWQWFARLERRVVDEKAKQDMQLFTISTVEGVAEGVETDCFDGAERS